MHHTACTAPGGARPHATFLAAVLLALLATLGIAGPPPGTTTEPVAAAVAAVDRHAGNGPGADDGCEAVGANEHPAPRGHLAACTLSTDVTPPVAPHLPAPAAHIPSSDPHAPRDRGRAPPVSSGI
jgi:hypothetical protein